MYAHLNVNMSIHTDTMFGKVNVRLMVVEGTDLVYNQDVYEEERMMQELSAGMDARPWVIATVMNAAPRIAEVLMREIGTHQEITMVVPPKQE
jgi:hypothetical protein